MLRSLSVPAGAPTIEYLRSRLLGLLWLLPAAAILALLLRFAMRALGVRRDIPFPGSVYSLTDPLVQPFYGLFPVSPRFDYHALEAASLAAAGVLFAVSLLVYALVLLALSVLRRKRE